MYIIFYLLSIFSFKLFTPYKTFYSRVDLRSDLTRMNECIINLNVLIVMTTEGNGKGQHRHSNTNLMQNTKRYSLARMVSNILTITPGNHYARRLYNKGEEFLFEVSRCAALRCVILTNYVTTSPLLFPPSSSLHPCKF